MDGNRPAGSELDRLAALAGRIEALLQNGNARSLDEACAAIDSLPSDLPAQELTDLGRRLKRMAASLGKKTKEGTVTAERLHGIAWRFRISAEAAQRTQQGKNEEPPAS